MNGGSLPEPTEALAADGVALLALDVREDLVAAGFLRLVPDDTPDEILAQRPAWASTSEVELALACFVTLASGTMLYLGDAASSVSGSIKDIISSVESDYPSRSVISMGCSVGLAGDDRWAEAELVRCHPTVRAVRHGSRLLVVPPSGWVVRIVGPNVGDELVYLTDGALDIDLE